MCGIIQVTVGLPSDNRFWITSHVSENLAYNNNAKDICIHNIQFRILCIWIEFILSANACMIPSWTMVKYISKCPLKQ